MDEMRRAPIVEPRSSRALTARRRPLEWPEDRELRILSIDGGGIRGIFAAAFLAEMENRYLGGASAASYFDLITGTSTGGIIALGLGAGIPSAKMLRLYVEDGRDIFPPRGRLGRIWNARRFVTHIYDRRKLEDHLRRQLGSRTLGESSSRLCIPSCDGTHGDVWVFKTPHHPDYRMDASRQMVDVALATSAAPTYFQPMESGGFRLLDGGLWANNPIMVGMVEAITALGASRRRIRVLSIGSGSEPYRVGRWKLRAGGQLWWRDVILGAMRYQSLGALGQARLLLGADRVDRIEPNSSGPPIPLDDWGRARTELPKAAVAAVEQHGQRVLSSYMDNPAAPYWLYDADRASTMEDTCHAP